MFLCLIWVWISPWLIIIVLDSVLDYDILGYDVNFTGRSVKEVRAMDHS